jgi:hypothetical protein
MLWLGVDDWWLARRLFRAAERRAAELVTAHDAEIQAVAAELLLHRQLSGDEIRQIIAAVRAKAARARLPHNSD